jgi:release factor glutamine methyltransferase
MPDPLIHEAFGVTYATDPDVYLPSDDTWLMAETVLQFRPRRFIEIGTGTGLIAIAAARNGAEVTATDLNPQALALARENAKRNQVDLRLVRADDLKGLRQDRIDLMAWNPPYLPTDTDDHLPGMLNGAFDGGPDGLGPTRKVLKRYRGPAPLLLLTSTLQPAGLFEAALQDAHLESEILGSQKLPFERLDVHQVVPRKG